MKKFICITLISILNLSASIVLPQSGWYIQDPYPTGDYLYTLKFFNQNTGIILKTTNSGINWTNIIPATTGMTYYSSYFINNNTGFLSGTGSNILKTTDQGQTWNGYETDNNYSNKSIFFISLAASALLLARFLTS